VADSADPKIVAIFNTNPEVLDLVREALQDAGYATVVAHVDEIACDQAAQAVADQVHAPRADLTPEGIHRLAESRREPRPVDAGRVLEEGRVRRAP